MGLLASVFFDQSAPFRTNRSGRGCCDRPQRSFLTGQGVATPSPSGMESGGENDVVDHSTFLGEVSGPVERSVADVRDDDWGKCYVTEH